MTTLNDTSKCYVMTEFTSLSCKMLNKSKTYLNMKKVLILEFRQIQLNFIIAFCKLVTTKELTLYHKNLTGTETLHILCLASTLPKPASPLSDNSLTKKMFQFGRKFYVPSLNCVY